MSFFDRLLNDPPPAFAFEVSEAGLAFARTAAPQDVKFQALAAGAVQASPLHDNVQNAEELAHAVGRVAPVQPGRTRRAAVILPDYSARVAVLDFDSLPDSAEEQRSLVRFRVKKGVPFDLDSAILSYHAQPRRNGRIDVVVAVIAREVVSRYEEAFRGAGFLPGYVAPSSLTALRLMAPDEITVFARLSGRVLSVMILDGPILKLARCVELDDTNAADIMSVLHPTMVYIEDELGSRAKRIVTCGFGDAVAALAADWTREWGVAVERLQSKHGAPWDYAAGLAGYMESLSA
jgi:type IV pilus assembly protein PilM